MFFKTIRKTVRFLSRFTVLLAFLFLLALAAFAWSFWHYQNAKDQLMSLQNGQSLSQRQLDQIMRGVSKHMFLPEGDPTIVVVKDATALTGQAFFKNAQTGDVVLVYPEQAIIYSPERHKIVNVGPVINNGQPSTQPNTVSEVGMQPTDTIVEVRNGSAIAGKASAIGNEINAIDGFHVTSTTNAKDKLYAQTVIVNLKGKDVSLLESKFGVTAVATLPIGEAPSTTDVVVILGN